MTPYKGNLGKEHALMTIYVGMALYSFQTRIQSHGKNTSKVDNHTSTQLPNLSQSFLVKSLMKY